MRRAAAQFCILAAVALAGHLPGWGQTTTSETATEVRRPLSQADHSTHSPALPTTGTVSIVASNLPLSRVAAQVKEQTGISITLKGVAGQSKVSVVAPKKTSIEDVLQQISASNPELVIKQSDDAGAQGYEIWDNSEYEAKASIVRVYQLNEAWAPNVERLVQPIISKSFGTVNSDERLNKLIVFDIPERQESVEKLIAELDLALTTRVFTLRHRRAGEMANYVIQFCNFEKDQLVADDASGQIAVRGTKAAIDRAAQLIAAFDVPAVSPPGKAIFRQ